MYIEACFSNQPTFTYIFSIQWPQAVKFQKAQLKHHKSSSKDLYTILLKPHDNFCVILGKDLSEHSSKCKKKKYHLKNGAKCNNVNVNKKKKCEHKVKTFIFPANRHIHSLPAGSLETICWNAQPAVNSLTWQLIWRKFIYTI